jgi:hypothetical protein
LPLSSFLFSVNQFKTWSKCQKKYGYDYVHQLRWPSDQSRFVFGKTLHKLFEYQARGLAFEPILNTRPNERNPVDEKIQAAWHRVMAHPIPHLPVLGSEWAFTVPVGNHWVTGRIDRVAWDPELNQVLILDWKTGTSVPRLPESDWQTLIYQYAVKEAYTQLIWPNEILAPHPLKSEQIQFVYLEIKEDINAIRIGYSDHKHQETRLKMTEAIDSMLNSANNKTFQLPPVCPDTFCPYLHICGIEAGGSNDSGIHAPNSPSLPEDARIF